MKLKKRTKILLLIGTGALAGLLCLNLEIAKEHYSFGYNEGKPAAVRRVGRSTWKSIETGMTKAKVLELAGTPEVKRKGDTQEVEVNGYLATVQLPESWHYNWAYADNPHIQSGWSFYTYVVTFDQDTGLVQSKETPERKLSYLYWLYRRYVSKN